MVTAGVRRAVLVIAAVGFAALLNGSARAADDEKKDPLREELLKLNSVTGDDAQTAKLRALVKDKEKAKKLVAEAAKVLKEAKDAKAKDLPLNFNGGLLVARLAHINKRYDVAEPLYEHLIETSTKLKSGSKMIEAFEGLIDMYWDNKKFALVSETCHRFIDDMGPEEYEDHKPLILERLAQSYSKEGKFDDALRLVDQLIELDKDMEWYFLQTKGSVLREQGKLTTAIETYTDALDKIDASKIIKGEAKDRLKDRVRYLLSNLYVDNKEIDKAAKQLQTLIKRNPDNPTYKNDLGFIWCDRDMNLEESEKLIREALDLDKKAQEKLKKDGKIDEVKPNAAYLDSLGWALFKQKKYKEALDPLKEAAADDEEGNHLEIWDHLADCYLALGQKKEAIATWEKGMKLEDVSPRDVERRKKVIEKLRKAGATVKD